MNTISNRLPRSQLYRRLLFLGAVIVLRAIGQFLLYKRGFLNVSADEFARGISAAQWALQPRFDLFDGPTGAWLPLERYLNGLMLVLWPDTIIAPRVTVFLASCLVLLGLYLLVRQLFGKFAIAALAIVFVVFQPWFVWLSGTPMLEMYFLGFFVLGFFFQLAWLKDDRRGYWIFAGLSFAIASGFHVQSWFLVNLFNLLTIGFLVQFIRTKEYGRLGRLVGYYFLSNAVIILFLAIEFYFSGEILGFLAVHTSYSWWFYGGYDVPIVEKLFYYPSLLLSNTSVAFWPLVFFGLGFLMVEKDRIWKLFPLMIALLLLLFSSISNVFSGPASAAPARYSLVYIVLLSPYLANGTFRIVQWARQHPSRLARYLSLAAALILFSYTLFWGAIRAHEHPGGHQGAVQAGRYLNDLLSQADLGETQTYMVELEYWDFLAVTLTAGYYDQVVYDREQDIRNRETPSIFEEEPVDVYDVLAEENVRYIALHDPGLKARVQEASFLSPQGSVDGWTIYEFEPSS